MRVHQQIMQQMKQLVLVNFIGDHLFLYKFEVNSNNIIQHLYRHNSQAQKRLWHYFCGVLFHVGGVQRSFKLFIMSQ